MISELTAYFQAQRVSNEAYHAWRTGTGDLSTYEAASDACLAAVQTYAQAVATFHAQTLTAPAVPQPTSPDRLTIAAWLATGLAGAPGTETMFAGVDREADHLARHALDLTDALMARIPQEWEAVTNPGDEVAMNNARTG